MKNKEAKLRNYIKKLERIVVAFSGGIDSTLVLKVALDELGKENVLAAIGNSETYSQRELSGALAVAKELDAKYLIIETKELSSQDFINNDNNRCYYCKSELFNKIKTISSQENYSHIVDGSNLDDLKDHRPGISAAKEHGVISPLQEVGFTKENIRELAKELSLSNWNKPAIACLSSRFAYGQKITKVDLAKVEKAEDILHSLNLEQIRVRIENETARIEVMPADFDKIIINKKIILEKFKKLGFTYTTLDLTGFRSGSGNEKIYSSKENTNANLLNIATKNINENIFINDKEVCNV